MWRPSIRIAGNRTPIAVVDVDPKSSRYSQIIAQVDMRMSATSFITSVGMPVPRACARTPRTRIWSGATSSLPGLALVAIACPRYPARSAQSEDREGDRAEEVAEKTGYSRCTPSTADGRHLRNAFGNAEGKGGPGGIFLLDPESFDVLGKWEIDRGSQQLAYDFCGTSVTTRWDQRMGTPDMFENGLVPELLLGSKYGRRLHFWDLHKRKHLQEIDLGSDHQLVFELRPAHDPTKAYGFVGCVISLKDLKLVRSGLVSRRQPMGSAEDHRDPGRNLPIGQAAARAEGLQGGAAARHRHRPVDGRPFPLRVVLGTGDMLQYDVSDPMARSSPARFASAASCRGLPIRRLRTAR